VLQLIVWVTYVSVSVTLFVRLGRRARKGLVPVATDPVRASTASHPS